MLKKKEDKFTHHVSYCDLLSLSSRATHHCPTCHNGARCYKYLPIASRSAGRMLQDERGLSCWFQCVFSHFSPLRLSSQQSTGAQWCSPPVVQQSWSTLWEQAQSQGNPRNFFTFQQIAALPSSMESESHPQKQGAAFKFMPSLAALPQLQALLSSSLLFSLSSSLPKISELILIVSVPCSDWCVVSFSRLDHYSHTHTQEIGKVHLKELAVIISG